MGRKSRIPAKIQSSISNEVTPAAKYELPQALPFIDIENGRSGNNLEITRFYLYTPTQAEARTARELGYVLVGGNTGKTGFKSNAIGNYASEKISELLSQQLSQLIIYALNGKKLAKSSIENTVFSLRRFIDFLSNSNIKDPDSFSIFNVQYNDWINYRSYLEESSFKDIRNIFGAVLSVFSTFPETNFSGSLKRITAPSNKRRMISNGHTLSFIEEDNAYSDAVMYQFLAHFIFRFEQQIQYLKHYEELSVDFMDKDWIYPGRKTNYVKDPNNKKVKRGQSDQFILLNRWLSDEEGYKRILDHKLLWYKLGCRGGKSFTSKICCFTKYYEGLNDKYTLYKTWERKTHFQEEWNGNNDVFGLYVKRSSSEDASGNMGQLAFCLANIVMIYTGLNKEVVLSWPSEVNGKSILDQRDSLFIKDNGQNKEIEIPGIKARTGILTKDKTIRVAIVVDSPLFKMLKKYEKYAKHDENGPFFEFTSNTFKRSWGGSKDKFKYSVMDDSGKLIQTLNTSKFRKVFATTRMLEHLKGVKNSQDLADRLRRDLDHNNFDVTLSHYILRSQNATNVLDLAIVTITSEKIRQALEFKGVIAINKKPKAERMVYLCECADPLNPTHGVAIAKKCTYYDLCVGAG
jgi:hypothetical protein